MTSTIKLQHIIDLIRREQSKAAEAYINKETYVSAGGGGTSAIDACVILDSLLEEAERIYNEPSGFITAVTNENALTPKLPQGDKGFALR
jgi:hypothetical protein